jgi:hypothetical protein
MSTWHYSNTTSTVVEVSFYIGSGAFVEPGQKLTLNDWEGGHMILRDPELNNYTGDSSAVARGDFGGAFAEHLTGGGPAA